MRDNHSMTTVHTKTEKAFESKLDCRSHDSLWIREERIDRSELKLWSRNKLGDAYH